VKSILEPPPGVVSWCKRNTYMTIEALYDGVNVNINKVGDANTGIFQIQLNNNDWKDVSWEDIGSEKDYNLISAAASRSSMLKGDKLRFRNIDVWASGAPANINNISLKIIKNIVKYK